ncbi:YaaA family protein [Microbacterium indicum]|uniref:YaaA family protein n=1 Tax=Microbacterium indicum TaxID=358100 RepID=UPI0003FF9E87|nr:peroxide stress protein YaaA [Microbacterium indicum]
MLLLLPPSETKRPGGSGAPLDLGALALPALSPQRAAALDALVALSADPEAAAAALNLSDRQRGEIGVNAAVRTAPTMPAIDRFTGVLFDALDAASLPAPARGWLGDHALIQTALLGPVGALDAVPAFRLSASSRLAALGPLKRHWAGATSAALPGDPLVVDLRSEAYRDLGPAPGSLYVRVVAEGSDGRVRALNHFNKKTKGLFARALALSAPDVASAGELLAWAGGAGIDLRRSDAPGELLLTARDEISPR